MEMEFAIDALMTHMQLYHRMVMVMRVMYLAVTVLDQWDGTHSLKDVKKNNRN